MINYYMHCQSPLEERTTFARSRKKCVFKFCNFITFLDYFFYILFVASDLKTRLQ